MILQKVTLELENITIEDLQKIKAYIELIRVSHNNEDNDNNSNDDDNYIKSNNTDNDFRILKKLMDNLTEKQLIVFQYFMSNPGPVYGDDLKQSIPLLRPQGALPGIFKATRHFMRLGGKKENSPFFSMGWDRSRGCGIYRGLSPSEIEYLSKGV